MKPPRITCDLKPALTRTAEQLLDYTTLTLRAPGVGVEYTFSASTCLQIAVRHHGQWHSKVQQGDPVGFGSINSACPGIGEYYAVVR